MEWERKACTEAKFPAQNFFFTEFTAKKKLKYLYMYSGFQENLQSEKSCFITWSRDNYAAIMISCVHMIKHHCLGKFLLL